MQQEKSPQKKRSCPPSQHRSLRSLSVYIGHSTVRVVVCKVKPFPTSFVEAGARLLRLYSPQRWVSICNIVCSTLPTDWRQSIVLWLFLVVVWKTHNARWWPHSPCPFLVGCCPSEEARLYGILGVCVVSPFGWTIHSLMADRAPWLRLRNYT